MTAFEWTHDDGREEAERIARPCWKSTDNALVRAVRSNTNVIRLVADCTRVEGQQRSTHSL
jgi:hypothetical protein